MLLPATQGDLLIFICQSRKAHRGDAAGRVAGFDLRQPACIVKALFYRVGAYAIGATQAEISRRIEVPFVKAALGLRAECGVEIEVAMCIDQAAIFLF